MQFTLQWQEKETKIICTTMAGLLTSLFAMGLIIKHLIKPKFMEIVLHFYSLQPFLFCPFFGIWAWQSLIVHITLSWALSNLKLSLSIFD